MSVNLEELKKEIIDNTATRVAKDLEERLGKKFLTHEEIQEMFKNWKPKKTEESDNLEEVVKFYRGLVKGTNISDEGTSGDLIPRTVSNRILEGLRKASWVRKYVTIFPDTKGTLFVKAQGATAYRTAPGNAPTGSTLQYTKIDYDAYELIADTIVSNRLLADANIPLINWIEEQLVYAFAVAEEKEFIQGASGNHEFIGLDNSSITTVTAASGHTDITKLTYDDILDLYMAVPQQYRSRAVWILHTDTLKVIKKLKDNNGLPIFSATDSTIFNRPFIECEHVAKTGTTNPVIYFGDWKGYYIFEKGRIQVLSTNVGKELVSKRQTYIIAINYNGGQAVIKDGMRGLKLASS